MDYTIIKWLHILSATILFGTGVGSAFFMFMASRSRNLASIHFAIRHVVIADWVFTMPSIIFQFLSGLYLVHLGAFNLNDAWLTEAIALYLFAGVCWAPVVWMQIKMRDMAAVALENEAALPQKYWSYFHRWAILGSLAFPAVIGIFWLMVAKPT